jgi:predicted DCC family thiol-disulfide oxidoreductase YuxK
MHKRIFLKLIDFCLYRNVENKSRISPGHGTPTRVFYDGACPLCRFEMQHLKRLDRRGKLEQVDISTVDFAADDWSANLEDLNRALHVITPANEWLVGMPAVRHVYREVGMGWLIVLTELPVIAALLDAGYLRFASNRMQISRWSGIGRGHEGCTDDSCGLNANIERGRV